MFCSKNLSGPLQQIWDHLGNACGHANKVGTLISWVSTASDGRYAIMTKGGERECSHDGKSNVGLQP